MTLNKDDLDYETTGHEWDGVMEYNKPMPRWWLWTFYATIVWAIGYTIAYPAWPLINGATAGVLGYATRAEVAKDIAAVEQANAGINARLEATELTAISADPELLSFANNAGGAVFRTWCAQCHGSGAAGAQASGYPNLLDDEWLWGGDIEAIHQTISYGIRTEENDQTRFSEMPSYGRDGLLDNNQISQVVNYVMSLSGQAQDSTLASAGAEIFANDCASCHNEDGTGDRSEGAPDLTDAIWLYGGSYDALVETVYYARNGVMPAWEGRLSEAEIRSVSAYVHGLGGGEPAPAE